MSYVPHGTKRMRRSLTLRTWLVLLIVGISGAGLAGSAMAVSSIMAEVIYSRVDEDLYTAANGWARDVEALTTGTNPRPPSDYYVATIFPDGSSIVFNDTTLRPDLSVKLRDGVPQTVGSVNSEDEPLSGAPQWRILVRENTDTHGKSILTIVGRSLGGESLLLARLNVVQLIIGMLVLVVLAVVAYLAIRRALKPLRTVEKTAARIASGEVGQRVPEWPANTEVGSLSQALNIMLEQLQRSLEEATNKEAQMRRFVGDASHELRTPLTSIRGYTELYQSGATQDANWVLEKVEEESTRMSVLVEDLLALTRAEGNEVDLHDVDILEVALAVVTSAKAAYPGRSIKVSTQTSEVPIVRGDASRLHRALLNLVSNALIHGGPDAEVQLLIRDEADQVIVDVQDNGRGMPDEVAAHIFERFYRADSSRSRASGGSGLGLAITRTLVEQHGGTITVESEEGEGSTFHIRLPHAPSSHAPSAHAPSSHASGPNSLSPNAPSTDAPSTDAPSTHPPSATP